MGKRSVKRVCTSGKLVEQVVKRRKNKNTKPKEDIILGDGEKQSVKRVCTSGKNPPKKAGEALKTFESPVEEAFRTTLVIKKS